MEKLAERFRYVRNLRGYTQQELAEAAYLTRGVITNIEVNEKKPQKAYLLLFSMLLNVNFEWLLEGTGTMEADNKIRNNLCKKISNLTESQQKFLLDMVEVMEEHLT